MIQNLKGTIYIYIYILFLPPVKPKKKVYIYKHFQDLKSKKKKKNHINNQISLRNIQNTKNISQNFIIEEGKKINK